MTRTQIIKIVGGASGNYTDGQYSGMADAFGCEGWVTQDYELRVRFNDQDIAVFVDIAKSTEISQPPTVFDRVINKLRAN